MEYSFYCFVLGIMVPNLVSWTLVSGVATDGRNTNWHSIVNRSEEKIGLSNEERIQLIRAHNHFRTTVIPRATNMLRMYWSAELESAAQYWSKKCIWEHGFPDLSKTRYKRHGQNIYLGPPHINMTLAIMWFASEMGYYNFDTNVCTKVCGHYTQVVWARSFLVGCGTTYCPNLKGSVLACNYHPPGNSMGIKPYTTGGDPCSGCKVGTSCKDNLCDSVQGKCPEEPQCIAMNTDYCLCEGLGYLEFSNRLSPNGLLTFSLVFCVINLNN